MNWLTTLIKKAYDFFVSQGKSPKSAKRKANKLAQAAPSAFRKLHPNELEKLGYSRTSKRYALKGARITAKTPTISEKAWRNKEAASYGLTPKTLPQARAHGAVGYRTEAQRLGTAKARITRFGNSLRDRLARDIGKKVEGYGGNSSYRITRAMANQVPSWREHKLAGGYVPDGDWHNLVDVARHYDDPQIAYLRMSPSAYQVAA